MDENSITNAALQALSNERLFTISRKIDLHDEIAVKGYPIAAVHHMHNNGQCEQNMSSSTIPSLPSDSETMTENVINILKDKNSSKNENNSPLFIRNKLITNSPRKAPGRCISPILRLENNVGDISSNIIGFNAPVKKLTPIQAQKLRSLKSGRSALNLVSNNDDNGESIRSGRRCGKPRYVPPYLEEIFESHDVNTPGKTIEVEVHVHSKGVRGNDTLSARSNNVNSVNKKSISARLLHLSDVTKHKNVSPAIPALLNNPLPVQVENLGTKFEGGTQKTERLFEQRRKVSDIVQMQLQELLERNINDDNKSSCEIMDLSADLRSQGRNENSDEESDKRAEWMQQLPQKLKDIPLHRLFLPGSHDSCSASLSWKYGMAPDVDTKWRVLAWICACFAQSTFIKWSVTQRSSVTEQLCNGVRYFDLRVAEKDGRFLFVHGMYGDDIQRMLEDILWFLQSHPGEVVLLDFQHLYNFDDTRHERLTALLKATFGEMLCPVIPVDRLTLDYLIANNYQVLIFYRTSSTLLTAQPTLWPSSSLPNPWPQTTNLSKMISFLLEKLDQRDLEAFYVTQCVLSPDTSILLKYWSSTLEERLAIPAIRHTLDNLPLLADRLGGCNVVMVDFVDHEDYALVRAVIKRNYEQYL